MELGTAPELPTGVRDWSLSREERHLLHITVLQLTRKPEAFKLQSWPLSSFSQARDPRFTITKLKFLNSQIVSSLENPNILPFQNCTIFHIQIQCSLVINIQKKLASIALLTSSSEMLLPPYHLSLHSSPLLPPPSPSLVCFIPHNFMIVEMHINTNNEKVLLV
jgi:hypothetical protein